MKNHSFLRMFHYFIECYLLYMFMFLFYMYKDILPPIIPFVIIVFGGGLLLYLTVQKIKFNSKVVLVSNALLIAAAALFLGYSYIVTFILIVFICLRIPAHIREADNQSEAKLLVFTFLLGILLYISANVADYRFSEVILILSILQVVFVMVGRVIGAILADSSLSVQSRKKQVKWYGGTIFGVLAGTTLLVFVLPVIKGVFFFFLKSISYIVGFLFLPLLYLLTGIEIENDAWDQVIQPDIQWGEDDAKAIEAATGHNTAIWWVVFAVLLIGITVIYLKRLKLKSVNASTEQNSYVTSTAIQNPKSSLFSRRVKAPKNEIRRLFFELERIAAKHNVGRMRNETARDWFRRLDFLHYEEVLTLYTRVRYAGDHLTAVEQEKYEQIIKELKDKIKEIKQNKQ